MSGEPTIRDTEAPRPSRQQKEDVDAASNPDAGKRRRRPKTAFCQEPRYASG